MTTAPPTAPRRRAALGPVGVLAGREISRLQTGYLADRSDAVAALARLRRGAGRDPATIPDLWGLLDTEDLFADPALRPDEAHTALYTAATLWSLHQQSLGARMHRAGGDELGAAVRRLMPGSAIDEPIRKRFVRAGTAGSLPVLATRLREITLLLRRGGHALDYALLADQLHAWQRPGGPDSVRSSWGRSFHAHRTTPPDQAGDENPATDQKDSRQ